MSTRAIRSAMLLLSVLTAGCVSMPSGPAVPVMPGSDKTLAQFQRDDSLCRGFASQQVSGTTPNKAAAASGVASAAIGTGVGAAAGAAFDGGEGAAVGAGSGLLFGSMFGLAAAGESSARLQYRYDNAYAQCMATQGNRLPEPPSNVAGLPPPPPGPAYVVPYYYGPGYYPPPPPPPYGYGYGYWAY